MKLVACIVYIPEGEFNGVAKISVGKEGNQHIEWLENESLKKEKGMSIKENYAQWCKETKRNGKILIGSMYEFFDYYEALSETSEQSTLQEENERLKEALDQLVQLKNWKDKYGKDEHYEKLQPKVWENAKSLLTSTKQKEE